MANRDLAHTSNHKEFQHRYSFDSLVHSDQIPSDSSDNERLENPKRGYFISDKRLSELQYKSCSVKNFSVNLLREIFRPDEIIDTNLSGSHGKKVLDPERVQLVKEYVFKMYPIDDIWKERTWDECRQAINEFCRRPGKRFSGHDLNYRLAAPKAALSIPDQVKTPAADTRSSIPSIEREVCSYALNNLPYKVNLPPNIMEVLKQYGDLTVDKLKRLRSKSCSVKNFSVQLLRELFTPEELADKNTSGSRGKGKLDPQRLNLIRDIVLCTHPTSDLEKDNLWKECTAAINESIRRPRRVITAPDLVGQPYTISEDSSDTLESSTSQTDGLDFVQINTEIPLERLFQFKKDTSSAEEFCILALKEILTVSDALKKLDFQLVEKVVNAEVLKKIKEYVFFAFPIQEHQRHHIWVQCKDAMNGFVHRVVKSNVDNSENQEKHLIADKLTDTRVSFSNIELISSKLTNLSTVITDSSSGISECPTNVEELSEANQNIDTSSPYGTRISSKVFIPSSNQQGNSSSPLAEDSLTDISECPVNVEKVLGLDGNHLNSYEMTEYAKKSVESEDVILNSSEAEKINVNLKESNIPTELQKIDEKDLTCSDTSQACMESEEACMESFQVSQTIEAPETVPNMLTVDFVCDSKVDSVAGKADDLKSNQHQQMNASGQEPCHNLTSSAHCQGRTNFTQRSSHTQSFDVKTRNQDIDLTLCKIIPKNEPLDTDSFSDCAADSVDDMQNTSHSEKACRNTVLSHGSPNDIHGDKVVGMSLAADDSTSNESNVSVPVSSKQVSSSRLHQLRLQCSSTEQFAVVLTKELYSPTELEKKGLLGHKGQRCLDPARLELIMNLVFKAFPTDSNNIDKVTNACTDAINEFLRSAIKRKYGQCDMKDETSFGKPVAKMSNTSFNLGDTIQTRQDIITNSSWNVTPHSNEMLKNNGNLVIHTSFESGQMHSSTLSCNAIVWGPLQPTGNSMSHANQMITELQGASGYPKPGELSLMQLEMIQQKSCSYKNFAVNLLRKIFHPKELEGKSVLGHTARKGPLDPKRVQKIKSYVFAMYPSLKSDEEWVWSKCRDAMNEFLRRPRKVFLEDSESVSSNSNEVYTLHSVPPGSLKTLSPQSCFNFPTRENQPDYLFHSAETTLRASHLHSGKQSDSSSSDLNYSVASSVPLSYAINEAPNNSPKMPGFLPSGSIANQPCNSRLSVETFSAPRFSSLQHNSYSQMPHSIPGAPFSLPLQITTGRRIFSPGVQSDRIGSGVIDKAILDPSSVLSSNSRMPLSIPEAPSPFHSENPTDGHTVSVGVSNTAPCRQSSGTTSDDITNQAIPLSVLEEIKNQSQSIVLFSVNLAKKLFRSRDFACTSLFTAQEKQKVIFDKLEKLKHCIFRAYMVSQQDQVQVWSRCKDAIDVYFQLSYREMGPKESKVDTNDIRSVDSDANIAMDPDPPNAVSTTHSDELPSSNKKLSVANDAIANHQANLPSDYITIGNSKTYGYDPRSDKIISSLGIQQLLKQKSIYCSPATYSVYLLTEFFMIHELVGKTVYGFRGKRSLDQSKIGMIREIVLTAFPCSVPEREITWKVCLESINDFLDRCGDIDKARQEIALIRPLVDQKDNKDQNDHLLAENDRGSYGEDATENKRHANFDRGMKVAISPFHNTEVNLVPGQNIKDKVAHGRSLEVTSAMKDFEQSIGAEEHSASQTQLMQQMVSNQNRMISLLQQLVSGVSDLNNIISSGHGAECTSDCKRPATAVATPTTSETTGYDSSVEKNDK